MTTDQDLFSDIPLIGGVIFDHGDDVFTKTRLKMATSLPDVNEMDNHCSGTFHFSRPVR